MKKTDIKQKHTGRKLIIVGVIVGCAHILAGWPFFYFITYEGKREEKKKNDPKKKTNRKKWFQLKHTEINHPKNGFAEEYERGRAWCTEQTMQDWYIHSRDGLRLHASFLPVEDPKRIVLLSHGYRGTKFGSVAHMAEYFHENHSDILFIDQRCCGESEGTYITFGAKEQYDVLDWIACLERKINDQRGAKDRLPIFLYGQSMGATTALLAAGHPLPKEVRGIIADCGFHSMKQQLRDIASGWFHLHYIGALLLRTDLFCHLVGHFHMKDTDTTEALKKNTRPVLFFHGEEDTYVWPENTVRNFELCRAPKELVLVPETRHLCCSYAAPELYKEKLDQFFEMYDGPSV